MKTYQVIFNDVPLLKQNQNFQTVYLPKQMIFQVKDYKELLEKLDEYILKTKIEFSSYEINMVTSY